MLFRFVDGGDFTILWGGGGGGRGFLVSLPSSSSLSEGGSGFSVVIPEKEKEIEIEVLEWEQNPVQFTIFSRISESRIQILTIIFCCF